jgi:hypothetical protein
MAETYFNLLQFLNYGKSNAITAEQLQHKFNDNSKLSDFKRMDTKLLVMTMVIILL